MAAPCSRPVSSGLVPAPVVHPCQTQRTHALTRTGTNTQKAHKHAGTDSEGGGMN
ncbi:hypothetical protein CCMA1212_001451 [Trichoderma ghanense]|uniref:Uncharacterized protein n=1 Tax=Trichoderma ghanense TaxID=65468 RepID=A0ABY2HI52_9HYPO